MGYSDDILTLPKENPELINIHQASVWASKHLKKEVTPTNISYLIQYGRIKKHGINGSTYIEKKELIQYYKHSVQNREKAWKKKLGQDLNWHLSFDYLVSP